ncbi:hypothetical protein DW718_09045 [Weissella cibaria]|nr:hypothetical protein DXA89_05220 [Weissella cibaria]RHE70543.1 hypothetical protein DW718_09045 [Weissella cibaria]RHE77219.1 hypothetical protein DW717_08200 [Weissella cibaria]
MARLQSNQATVDNDEVPVEKISEKPHRIVVEVQEKPQKAPKAKFRLIQVGAKAWPVDEWDLDPKLQSVLVTTAAKFPAIYYARHFKPQGIIVSKVIVNLGAFSDQDGFVHGGTKDWPLDMRRHLFGRVLRADTLGIDQKLWQSMDHVDWTQVATYVFSLAQDEYDGQSLPQLLRFIKNRGGSVEHFWLEGDHLAHI